jgi:hypothetical protein
MPEQPPASAIPEEPPADPAELEQQMAEVADADYGPPFDAKDFGGQFIWAQSDNFEAKILRVRAGKKVIISTRRRKDMTAMLTGGRGVLEVIDDEGAELIELLPGTPVAIQPGPDYRLVAITEIELFTVHSPDPDAE